MNVTFTIGETVNGFTVVGKNGLTRFIVENEEVRICFDTNAGEGINYSKIISYYDKRTNRSYIAMRFLRKYVHLVQSLSNALYDKYKEANETVKL